MREPFEQALREDGDGYHSRNYEGIGTIADPVFDVLNSLNQTTRISSVLEVGCTTGFRLEKARTNFGASCCGLEVSPAAVSEGIQLYPHLDLREGVAPRDLDFWRGRQFDVVILGHFLYLLPREELFALAAAVDSLLSDDGHLVITDFFHAQPHSSRYLHDSRLRVFKHNPSAAWTWSPTFVLVDRQILGLTESSNPRAWQSIDVLRKIPVDIAYPAVEAWPSVHPGRE